MALFKNFSAQSKSLPDPNDPLSRTVKPQAIESSSKKVSVLTSYSSAKDDSSGPSHGPYMKFLTKQKAQVARYVIESGNK